MERVAGGDAADLRQTLAADVLANASVVADRGVADFCEHALLFAADRLAATLVIVSTADAAAGLRCSSRE